MDSWVFEESSDSISSRNEGKIRLFWTKQTVKEGARFLAWWFMDAYESGISELEKAGRTLLRHWQGLINYFKTLSTIFS